MVCPNPDRRSSDFMTSRDQSVAPKNQLPAMERFGMVALGVAFHASKTEDRPEEVLGEPTLADLAREAPQKRFDFAAADRFVERHENVRGTEVPVVFRDLVFEDEVIPERVPRE